MDQQVDLEAVYQILRTIARTKDTITYQEMSDAYLERTGYRFDRRQWGRPLGDVSWRCTDHGLPPIRTIVVSETDKMPSVTVHGAPHEPPA